QLLHLVLEHEIEGRAQQAAERGYLLGQTADPEVDAAETGGRDAIKVFGMGAGVRPLARTVEEVEAVDRCARAAQNDGRGRRTLRVERGSAGDGIVRAIRGDEVDERLGVLEVLNEVGPARVGLQVGVADVCVELSTSPVQGRNPGVATAREVENREVER